jgi:hypothetical protein
MENSLAVTMVDELAETADLQWAIHLEMMKVYRWVDV